MANSTIQDLSEATDVNRATTAIEVETDAPASRKMSIRNAMGMGWAYYEDGTYTSGSPLSVNNALVQLLIDGLGANTEKDQLPVNSSGSAIELWNTLTDKITPINVGDAYDLRLDFQASTATPSTYMDLKLDIGTGTPNNIVTRTLTFPKGTGTAHSFSVGFPIFTLATFLSNGGKLMLDTTGLGANVSVWDIGLFIKRDYASA
jgi:hypothetical protein